MVYLHRDQAHRQVQQTHHLKELLELLELLEASEHLESLGFETQVALGPPAEQEEPGKATSETAVGYTWKS
jgi:hypothetical protein